MMGKSVMLAVAGLAVAGVLAAQNGASAVARVPFGPGERAEYTVTLGMFGEVGEGFIEVVGLEEVQGHTTYRLRFDLDAKVAFARVDDTLESWLDVRELFSRRFHQDQHEVNYKRKRTLEFFPDLMKWKIVNSTREGELASPIPLDEVSFLFFARTLPLKPGDVYTFDRYYKADGNPVVLKVLRRERLKASDGSEVPVVVVRPIIQTSGLFGEGGEAEVYFTDDDRRILIQMRSKVPVIGRLGLYLKGYTPGKPLH